MRDKVFISYSHKDKKFLDELITHLKPLEREGRLNVWSDKQIAAGSNWRDEIQSALASTKVAVFLVTKDFLASDFIVNHEMGPLLAAAASDGVIIYWVLVRACNWHGTPIETYQAAFPPAKPLAEMRAERDAAWVSICKQVSKIAGLPVGGSRSTDATLAEQFDQDEVARCIVDFRQALWDYSDSRRWIEELSISDDHPDSATPRAELRNACGSRNGDARQVITRTFPMILEAAGVLGIDVCEVRQAIVQNPLSSETLKKVDDVVIRVEERLNQRDKGDEKGRG